MQGEVPMPFSASKACTSAVSAWAGEWPIDGVGGGQPLGIVDGGQRALLAR
jgi:hypothetical protein